jgi:hypothetical protein
VCFEKVLEKDPQNHEAMKILGSLLAKEKSADDRGRAETYLKKVVTTNPADLEAWVELAEIQERKDLGQALQCIPLPFSFCFRGGF